MLDTQIAMKPNAVLSLLQDGQVHSGEHLAEQLGVSRTAVWKQLRKAMDEGCQIETVRGRGYRLLQPVDLLDEADLVAALADDQRRRLSLTLLEAVDSTNAEVIRRWPTAAGIPVCIADCQTAGRGRRGRTWQSPKGENLYMSLGLTFQGGFAALDGLSLVLGVAVAEALESLGAAEVGLKWPNDIFAPGGKLGGILVELQGEWQEGIAQVIVGIGINVHMNDAGGVDQPWRSLDLAYPEQHWSRNRIAAAILGRILACSDQFAGEGFAPFIEPWQSRDIFRDKALRARDGALAGIGAGIDASGNYLLDTDEGRVAVRAGEISLRAAS